YVLDMYRELIEGAAFLVPQILKHMDTSAGSQMGRIYRIAPDGFRFQAPPRLGDMGTAELVKYYEHANAWQRDTASRLVYQRQDAAAVEPLRQVARQSASPLARTMALYSLQGLGALEPELVLAALQQGPSPARQHAMRLAESFPSAPALEAEVVRLAASNDVTIRYQAAFSLGAFPSHRATAALAKLGVRDGADKWMELAVLSSVSNRRGEFLALLLADPAQREMPHVRALLGATAAQVGAANDKSEIAALLRQIEELAGSAEARPVAVSLVRSLVGKQASVRELLRGTAGTRTQEIVAQILRDALATAQDDGAKPAARAAAIRSLSAADFTEVQPLFADLLQSRQPQPVQAAALETLARFDSADVPQMIVAMWPAQTPQLRATSIETLFSRAAWLPVILDALENQLIAPADLDAPHAALLRDHRDEAIRTRAAKLLASSALAHRQEVVDGYQPALEKVGDVERGRAVFRKNCSACHRLENYGEAIGAELSAIRDRGLAAVMLNILDPNREVKPQFLNYVVVLDNGRALSGMIKAETANSLTIRKADNTDETVLRVNIEELASTGISFMPEGLEKQVDVDAMADLLAYLNSIK
ncbi:MAG: c-type cytochrome, partial [Pirellulaceae bacterium]